MRPPAAGRPPLPDPTPEAARKAARTLDRSLAVAQDLLELLGREEEAMRRRDASALRELAEAKRVLVDEIERLAEVHRTGLAALGVVPGAGSGADAAARALERAGVDGARERLRALARCLEACRHANAVNRGVLGMLARFNERALTILFPGGNAGPTYGRRGESAPAIGPRYVTRA